MDCFNAGAVPNVMRHVALLLEYPTLYGGEHSILTFCNELSRHRFTFSVICPPGERMNAVLTTLKIRHLPFLFRDSAGSRFPLEKLRNDLTSLLREHQIHILHANSLSTSRIAGPVGAVLRVPTVGHVRDIMRVSSQAMDDINCCTRILCVSQATLEYHRHAGLDEIRSDVQYNGVDLSRFYPDPKPKQLRERYGIDPESVVIGTAGQIILRKGLDNTVRAFALIADQMPDAQLVIAGERNSRKTETVLYDRGIRNFVKSRGLNHRIHFVGYLDDMAEFYRSLDIFVHSARQEPLGRVLLEAAACGVPVIATHVGGTEEIFSRSGQALLIQPDDPTIMANAIERLVEDFELRSQLGKRGYEAIKARFDILDVSRALISHYQRLLEDTTTRS